MKPKWIEYHCLSMTNAILSSVTQSHYLKTYSSMWSYFSINVHLIVLDPTTTVLRDLDQTHSLPLFLLAVQYVYNESGLRGIIHS